MTSGYKYIISAFITIFSLTCYGQANFLWDENGVSQIQLETQISAPEHLALKMSASERAVAGSWKTEEGIITFTPFVPLDFNTDYVVTYLGNLLLNLRTPVNPSESPSLLAIHPTPDTLPENLLKIQLVFDREMQSGQSSKYVAIYEVGNEKKLENVFLDLSPELWNTRGDTLTLWLNPGRIKRDLIPNRQEGNPLEQGKSYKITVNTGWMSARGKPLEFAGSKTFYVSGADREYINPGEWTLTIPKAGTKETLQIKVNEPLDLMSAPPAIEIRHNNGKQLKGKVWLSNEQNIIYFKPINNWNTGRYSILIGDKLEDIAGNRMTRLFDEDLFDQKKKGKRQQILYFTLD